MHRLRRCLKFGLPLVAGLTVISLALAFFAGLADEVLENEAIFFDASVLDWLARVASPRLTQVALAITTTGAPLFLIPVVAVAGVLWWRQRRADWIALGVTLAGAFVLNQLAKLFFARARPSLSSALAQAAGYSFPSGHSQAAFAFYGILAYLLARRAPPRWRAWIYLAAGAWILLVGLSRNYLGVHYPSDVLAAYAMTLPWLLAVIFVHQCYVPRAPGEHKVIQPDNA